MWGFFPLYWPLLEPAGAVEILAHRIVWSLIVMLGVVLALRKRAALRATLADRRTRWLLALAAVLIAVNWGTYIYGVNSHHVVETSLGYFINPLVSVLLGVSCSASGCAGCSGWRSASARHRGAGADRGLRPAAVDRAGPGVLVRHLRAGQEEGERGRGGEPGRRDAGGVAGRARLHRLPDGDRRLDVRRRRRRARRCCWSAPVSSRWSRCCASAARPPGSR